MDLLGPAHGEAGVVEEGEGSAVGFQVLGDARRGEHQTLERFVWAIPLWEIDPLGNIGGRGSTENSKNITSGI